MNTEKQAVAATSSIETHTAGEVAEFAKDTNSDGVAQSALTETAPASQAEVGPTGETAPSDAVVVEPAATSASCAICGAVATHIEPYRAVQPAFDHIFGGRRIFVCDVCGFGNTQPSIPDEQLGEYYSGSFDPRYFKRVEGGDWPFFDERSVSQIMLGRLFTDFKEGDGFLDVGPGVGSSFFSADQLLDKPRKFGVEMNLAAIALMKKNIPGITIVDSVTKLAEATKDVPLKMCVTSHCLEHYNGEGVIPGIREIYERMAPGGVIVAEVPHWPLKRWNYRRDDIPHLSFFSQDSLERAITAGGFDVVYANIFGIPHKSNRHFETERRKAAVAEAPSLRRDGADFLLIGNSGDFKTRQDGKILRVIGRKSA